MSSRDAARRRLLQLAGPALVRALGAGPCPHRRLTPTARVLLVRPDHLGDLLLTTPAGQALGRAVPAARIDWLVGPWAVDVIRRAHPRGEVLTCAFPGFTRQPKGRPWSPYVVLAREARRLRARAYDLAIVLRPDHWWGAMLVALAGIPVRVGYAAPECHPFLTHALPIREPCHAVERSFALAERAVELLAPGARLDRSPAAFVVSAEEQAWAEAVLGPAARRSDTLIAVHPGSGSPIKHWPTARWHEVVGALQRQTGAAIVLTGSHQELPLVREIVGPLEPQPSVLAGQTDLGRLAAVFARCSLVIGSDSGPLHLAAAVGTPTLRIYGPTDPATFGPWGAPDRHRVLHTSLPCQPCGNIVAPPCGAVVSPACMRLVSSDQVVQLASALLDQAAQPSGC